MNRSETDAVKTPVYLDHHSTTPCAPEVVEAMLPFFRERFGNPSAIGHAQGRAAARLVATAKARIAALLGAMPESVVLTAGASEANNLALRGVAEAALAACSGEARRTEGRDEIAIGAIEHPSVRAAAERLVADGFRVVVLPVDADGFVDPEAVRARIGPRTLLVSVMAANHEIGTIQPIAEIAAIAKSVGALFHSDATQAVGKLPIDVERDRIDLLSLSGHKFHGPPGIGALVVRRKPPVALAPLLLGGGQQGGLRSGTVPLALAVGLGAACELAGRRMVEDGERLDRLGRRLLDGLRAGCPSLAVNGGLSPRLPGSLNLRFSGVSAAELLDVLADDLCLATGSACGAGNSAPSRVLKAIGLDDEACASSIRLSLGRDSTEAEVDFAVSRLLAAIARSRN